jgi:3-hydroxybutyryl-CoA dehydrogenase
MHNIQSIGVVGLGQMGRGIAQVAIQSGFSVVAFDAFPNSLTVGSQFISDQLKKGVEKQKWTQDQATQAIAKLKTTSKLEDLSQVDIVIEAATENKNLKFELFKKLDGILKPEALLASNTSSISITEIAACTKRSEKVAGMHFMNPVPVMKLVEGISGLSTSPETFNRIEALAKSMGKTFVKAQDYPGFAVNRILMPMINEAFYALYEGVANASDIDQAMKLGTNQPMGPLELADFIGLDTCLAIMNVLHEGLGDTKYRACPLLKNYVASGKLGRKTKSGVFNY